MPYTMLFAALLGFAMAPVQAQDSGDQQQQQNQSDQQQQQNQNEEQNKQSKQNKPQQNKPEQNKPSEPESGTYTFTFERMAKEPEGGTKPQSGGTQSGAAPAQSTPPQQETAQPQGTEAKQGQAPAESTAPQLEAAQPQGSNAPSNQNPQPAPAPVETIPVQPTDQAKKEEPAPPKRESETGAAQLETVTVTASKRAQALEKVPGSVAALTGNQLEKMHAKDMEDYLKLIPGVSFAKGDADQGVPIIRGIGTNTSLGGLTGQPTGVFIDDVPFTDASIPLQVPDMNPFDLERVEVLKGPQGTLFGASSLAGAIHYVTHKPDLGVFESKFQGSETAVEDPSDRKPMGALALNIPLGSSAALRGVGLYRQSPGYIDVNDGTARTEKDVNSLRQHAGRLLGKWDISDNLNLSASYFRQFDLQSDTSLSDTPKKLERDSLEFAIPNRQTFGIGNVVATYDLGWASLLSSTSRKTKNTFIGNISSNSAVGPGISGTPNPTGGSNGTGGPGAEDQSTVNALPQTLNLTVLGYSQEFRLISPEGYGNWEWQGGAYFLHELQKLDQVQPNATVTGAPSIPPLLPIIPTPVGPVGDTQAADFVDAFTHTIDTEESLFGDVTRRLGDRWALTTGGRLFRTTFDSNVFTNGAVAVAATENPNSPSTTPPRHSAKREIGFNPKISARFQANPNVMTYVLVSKGFQFGGTQLVIQLPAVEGEIPQSFKSSNLWNFETGTRTEWLDRRLSLDATVFYERWSDLQLTELTNDPSGSNSLRFNFVGNVGRARSLGGEVGLRAIPFTGLTLSSSLARINAVTTVPFEDAETQKTLPPGTRLPGTPRFQIANVLAYEPRFGGWTPGLTLTHSHIGTSFNNLRGTNKLGGYNTFDARINLLKSNLSFRPDLSFAVTNIFDKRGISSHNGEPTDRIQFFNFIKPRTAELTLDFRFD